jgi:hypothetical protein
MHLISLPAGLPLVTGSYRIATLESKEPDFIETQVDQPAESRPHRQKYD